MKWKNESLLKFKSNFDWKYLFKMKYSFKSLHITDIGKTFNQKSLISEL